MIDYGVKGVYQIAGIGCVEIVVMIRICATEVILGICSYAVSGAGKVVQIIFKSSVAAVGKDRIQLMSRVNDSGRGFIRIAPMRPVICGIAAGSIAVGGGLTVRKQDYKNRLVRLALFPAVCERFRVYKAFVPVCRLMHAVVIDDAHDLRITRAVNYVADSGVIAV